LYSDRQDRLDVGHHGNTAIEGGAYMRQQRAEPLLVCEHELVCQGLHLLEATRAVPTESKAQELVSLAPPVASPPRKIGLALLARSVRPTAGALQDTLVVPKHASRLATSGASHCSVHASA